MDLSTVYTNALPRPLGAKTVPNRPSPTVPRPQHPFGYMSLNMSSSTRRVTRVTQASSDAPNSADPGSLEANTYTPRPTTQPNRENAVGTNPEKRQITTNTSANSSSGANPSGFQQSQPLLPATQLGRFDQVGPNRHAPVTGTYPPFVVDSILAPRPNEGIMPRPAPFPGNKRRRLTGKVGDEENEVPKNSSSTVKPPALARSHRNGALEKMAATDSGHGMAGTVPLANIIHTTTRHIDHAKDDDAYQEETPEQDTPRQTVEVSNPYETRYSTRRRAEGTSAVTTPAPTPSIDPSRASHQHVGPPRAQVSQDYVLNPQLQGIKTALGDGNWKAYLTLIEGFVNDAVTQGQLEIAERNIFQTFNERMRNSIRKKVCNMISARKAEMKEGS